MELCSATTSPKAQLLRREGREPHQETATTKENLTGGWERSNTYEATGTVRWPQLQKRFLKRLWKAAVAAVTNTQQIIGAGQKHHQVCSICHRWFSSTGRHKSVFVPFPNSFNLGFCEECCLITTVTWSDRLDWISQLTSERCRVQCSPAWRRATLWTWCSSFGVFMVGILQLRA